MVPKAILLKDLKFKENAIYLFVCQLISSFVAVVLALNNFSYFSIVIKVILESFLSFILFYLKTYKFIGMFFSEIKIKDILVSIRKIYVFSKNQFIFNIVNYISKNLDNILIAKVSGSTSLAFYDKSYKLMLMPVHNLTHVITPVFLPVLSKYNNTNKVFADFKKLISLLSIIGFPLSVFLFFSSSELILLVYGSQWKSSVLLFKILSMAVGFLIILSSFGSIFQVLNKTDLLLKSGIFSCLSLLLFISSSLFVFKSIYIVCYFIVLAIILNFLYASYLLICKGFKNNFLNFVYIFKIPFYVTIFYVIFFNLFELIFDFQYLLTSLFVKLFFYIISFLLFNFWNKNLLFKYLFT